MQRPCAGGFTLAEVLVAVFVLAVGIIIGAAFGKIVSSFVGDVVMPPLGLIAFTPIKIANATMIKSITLWMNLP